MAKTRESSKKGGAMKPSGRCFHVCEGRRRIREREIESVEKDLRSSDPWASNVSLGTLLPFTIAPSR